MISIDRFLSDEQDPKAVEKVPILASSHDVPPTFPALKADFLGFQTILVPIPEGATAPVEDVPVETKPSVPIIVTGPVSAIMVLPKPAPPKS